MNIEIRPNTIILDLETVEKNDKGFTATYLAQDHDTEFKIVRYLDYGVFKTITTQIKINLV